MLGQIIITGLEATLVVTVFLGIICAAGKVAVIVNDATDSFGLYMLSFFATIGVGLTLYVAALYELGALA